LKKEKQEKKKKKKKKKKSFFLAEASDTSQHYLAQGEVAGAMIGRQ